MHRLGDAVILSEEIHILSQHSQRGDTEESDRDDQPSVKPRGCLRSGAQENVGRLQCDIHRKRWLGRPDGKSQKIQGQRA